ncbi:MAG: DUF2029 domain-containing protein [Acidobacteriia bacterium]|nr:DUF2029 domain-containing protein [Terriglobia bacterium]
MATSQNRALVNNLLLLLALLTFLAWFTRYSPDRLKGTDFPDFYSAARIVQEGRGHELYKVGAQDEYLARYSGRLGTYFIHPPVETLLYLPFSIWPLYRAYQLWCGLNVVLLVIVAKLVAPYAIAKWSWRVLLPFIFLFPPVLLNLLQGQDAVLLLLLFTSAFAALRNKREFAAGCLLACGLFKFHLVLAAFLPLLFGTSKRLLTGFASVALALLLISAKISGWAFLVEYPRFLVSLSSLPMAGIHNQQMANLRGLFGLLFPDMTHLAMILTISTSLLVLWLAVRGCTAFARSGQQIRNLAFANAVIAAVLVSYHLSPHDLTILLLPMALVLTHVLTRTDLPRNLRLAFLGTLGILFLPPLYLWLLNENLYTYICIPVLMLFGLTYAEIQRLPIQQPSNGS